MDNSPSKLFQDLRRELRHDASVLRESYGPKIGASTRDNEEKDSYTSKELQREMAAVKKTLNDIVVSLQSANEKITRISEAIAISSLSNGDSNQNNHRKQQQS